MTSENRTIEERYEDMCRDKAFLQAKLIEAHDRIQKLESENAMLKNQKPSGTAIGWFELSTRAYNALLGAGLLNSSDIVNATDEELLSIHALGKSTLAEIRAKIPYQSTAVIALDEWVTAA